MLDVRVMDAFNFEKSGFSGVLLNILSGITKESIERVPLKDGTFGSHTAFPLNGMNPIFPFIFTNSIFSGYI